jgi:hypothetical protein
MGALVGNELYKPRKRGCVVTASETKPTANFEGRRGDEMTIVRAKIRPFTFSIFFCFCVVRVERLLGLWRFLICLHGSCRYAVRLRKLSIYGPLLIYQSAKLRMDNHERNHLAK